VDLKSVVKNIDYITKKKVLDMGLQAAYQMNFKRRNQYLICLLKKLRPPPTVKERISLKMVITNPETVKESSMMAKPNRSTLRKSMLLILTTSV
jgi:hypothetical protein